jgi:hypothetical protein
MAESRGRACRAATPMLTSFDHSDLTYRTPSIKLVNQTTIPTNVMKHTYSREQSNRRAHHVQAASRARV